MSLSVGARLGHYAVTAKLGESGMGEVWRATDTQLNRDVGLKILPEAFAADPDRLARFQREAQVLASLSHPGIAAIYGIEEQDDTRALVLELRSWRHRCLRRWRPREIRRSSVRESEDHDRPICRGVRPDHCRVWRQNGDSPDFGRLKDRRP